MAKTPQTVTKDSGRQERSKKSYETYIKRLKEKILKDNQLSTSSPTHRPTSSTSSSTDNSTPSTSSSTDRSTPSTPSSLDNSMPSTSSSTTRSSDTYIYGVGILAVLAVGVCVFFAYNKKAGQVIHEQPINQNDIICFRSGDKKPYTINE